VQWKDALKKKNNKDKFDKLQKQFDKLWGVFGRETSVVLKPAGVLLGEWDVENQCRKKK